MKRLMIGAVLALAVGGCATVTTSTGAPVVGEPLEGTAWVLAWGLVGSDVNIPAYGGAARVRVSRGVGGWLVGALTLGLVQPMSVEVWPVGDRS